MITSRAAEPPSSRFKVEDVIGKLPAQLRAEFLKLSPQEQQFLLSMNGDEAKVYATLPPAAGSKFATLPKAERRAEGKLARVAQQVERVQAAARPLAVSAAKLAGTSLTAPAVAKPVAPKPVPLYAPKAVSPVGVSLASVKAGAVLCAAVAKKPAGSGALLAARQPAGRSRSCGRAPMVAPSKMMLLFSGGVLRP
jgi:hypothetical protein